MKKVLILTASLGNGHITAAKEIYQREKSKGHEVNIIDLTEICIMGKIMKWCFRYFPESALEYIFIQTNTPHPQKSDKIFYRYFFPELRKYFSRNTADLVICTFPAFILSFQDLYHKKITTQVTDHMTPHYSWIWGNPDCIYVLDTESKKHFSTVSESEIKVSPFPLPIKNNRARSQSHGQHTQHIVLFFHHVLLGNEERIITRTLEIYPDHHISILAGSHTSFFQKRYSQSPSISVFGWQNDIDEWYSKASIVGGKCGGAFISEVMQRNLPLIVTGVFSGQEKGNYEYLKKYYSHNLIDFTSLDTQEIS